MSTSSFGKNFMQGVGWFFFLRVFSRIVSFVQILIVARLLEPKDFGLLGVASLAISLMSVFSGTGYHQAITQKKNDISEYLDTVWVVEVVRGAFLSVVIFLGAPLIAMLFKVPDADQVLKAMAFVPLLNGVASPGLAMLNRELRFRRLVVFQAIQSILVAILTILVAYLLRSVWALVAAALFGAAIASFGSFFVHPYRPGKNFDFDKAKELWGYGRWVLASQVLHYLFNDGDDWVVGTVLGAQSLGFYRMAYNIGNTPATEVTAVFSQVAFPAFSRIQEDLGRMRAAYLRIMQITMFLSTPISIGIWLVAADATSFAMGEKWMPMVASLQILLIWGWTRSFRATIGPVLSAIGQPDKVAKFTLYKVILLAVLVMPFSLSWGIEGTSWSVVLAAIAEIPLMFQSLHKGIQIHYSDLFQAVMRPLWPALPMIAMVLLCQKILLVDSSVLLRLIVSILLGSLVYLAGSFWLDRKFGWNVVADLQTALISNLQPLLKTFKSAPK